MKKFVILLITLLFLAGNAFAATTGSFTAAGQISPVVSFKPGETVSFQLGGSFTGTVLLESSKFTSAGWTTVTSATDTTVTTAVNGADSVYYYRLRCTAIGEAETITYSLSESGSQVAQSFKDADGVTVMNIVDGGVTLPGTLTVSGATTVNGLSTTAS